MKKLLLFTAFTAFLFSCQTPSKLHVNEQWKLTQLNSKDLTKTNVEITLNFDTAKMEITGKGGCNNYFGNYKLNENELEVGELGATKMSCGDDDLLENEYFQALQGKLNLKNVDNRLEMTKEGKTVMVFVKK